MVKVILRKLGIWCQAGPDLYPVSCPFQAVYPLLDYLIFLNYLGIVVMNLTYGMQQAGKMLLMYGSENKRNRKHSSTSHLHS